MTVEVVGLPGATAKPTTVTIVVTGAPEVVAELQREALIPYVEPVAAGEDVTKPGSANVRVQLDLADVKVDITPKDVLVKW